MNKIIYFIILCLIILFFIILKIFYVGRENNKFIDVKIGSVIIRSEVVDTPMKKFKGLSGRESLENGTGMLFIFYGYSKPAFVMRDMKFSIDIIWIRDTTVVDISKNLPLPIAGGPLIEYAPLAEVNRVLEVPAGFSDSNNVTIGDTLGIFMPKT